MFSTHLSDQGFIVKYTICTQVHACVRAHVCELLQLNFTMITKSGHGIWVDTSPKKISKWSVKDIERC
jgi:hypothetical protein